MKGLRRTGRTQEGMTGETNTSGGVVTFGNSLPSSKTWQSPVQKVTGKGRARSGNKVASI
jgi:hypothetical protein